MKRFAFKKETDSPNGIEWKDGNSKRTSTKQILILLVCLCFVCVGGVQAVVQFSQFSKPLGEKPKPAVENITNLPNQIIVIYKPQIANTSYLYHQVSSTAAARVAALNVTKLQLKNIEGAELVTLPANSSIESAIGIYLNNSFVLSAEPRYIPAHKEIVPNNPSYSAQWAFRNTGQLVNGNYDTSGANINALNGMMGGASIFRTWEHNCIWQGIDAKYRTINICQLRFGINKF